MTRTIHTKILPKAGFTLVELLVAMTILSVVISSVYGAFHAGTMASRRLLREGAPAQNMTGHLNLMASEMRNAVYWNNLVMVGTAKEVYFYTPMVLKDPRDLLPLYRVRYWIEKKGDKAAVIHRGVIPWIALQRPGLDPDNIPALETAEEWLGPLDNFRLDYAVAKKKQPVEVFTVDEDDKEAQEAAGIPVDGNPGLVWKTSYDVNAETPFGVRMQWTQTSEKGEEVPRTAILWPALGLFQSRTDEGNVAPTSQIKYMRQ